MSDTDLELLSRYSQHHAEDAFAELVRRHLNLVYSAALRQVRSPQLAEEVAQSAFFDLARNAAQNLPRRAVERRGNFFANRGTPASGGGLMVVISANAAQSAPVGLAVTISPAAALPGTALTATATVTKAIAMTATQKVLIAA